jgi:hypothetical protein
MAHLGRILHWPRPKAVLLTAGIQAVYRYERLGEPAADGIPARADPA